MEKHISGHTQLIGLLGSPVSHSISPLMHNEAFRLLGLDYAYLCFDVGCEQLETTVKGLTAMGARGWNCTMPDKTAMCSLVDELSPAAAMIGAVNTVVNENGVLTGHNTDGIGYMRAVQEAGYNIIGKNMTLLGAGGAATAIAVQAALDGVARLDIFGRRGGRSWEHAQKLVRMICDKTNCKAALYDLNDAALLQWRLEESDILTNGTSVGMAPNPEACILPEDILLPANLIVSDVIYNPKQTTLMQRAKEAGCPTFNGLYMLLYQGAEAFRLWTGQDMPVEQIKEKYFSNRG